MTSNHQKQNIDQLALVLLQLPYLVKRCLLRVLYAVPQRFVLFVPPLARYLKTQRLYDVHLRENLRKYFQQERQANAGDASEAIL